MKKVVYNGRADELGVGEGNVRDLIPGRQYTVALEEKYPYYTLYSLKGVSGTFNSVLFEDEVIETHYYSAYSKYIPVQGRSYKCWRLVYHEKSFKLQAVNTAIVKSVIKIAHNMYQVSTPYNTFFVQII